MKEKKHILIVEDEAILFQKMHSYLFEDGYSVDKYTKSFEEAINRIEECKPDLVLLDIELVGEKTGIDLGKLLYRKYRIPFIFITSFGDKQTFEKALESVPELFLVKTKPTLDYVHLTRQMQVVLHKTSESVLEEKKGLRVLLDYADKFYESSSDTFKKTLLFYDSIVSIQTDYVKTLTKTTGRKNYLRIIDKEGELYYFQGSLVKLQPILPVSFCRISGSVIVNLHGDFNLSISPNYSRVEINEDITFEVSRRFRKNLRNKS